jgi:hypothetical protein
MYEVSQNIPQWCLEVSILVLDAITALLIINVDVQVWKLPPFPIYTPTEYLNQQNWIQMENCSYYKSIVGKGLLYLEKHTKKTSKWRILPSVKGTG